MFGITIPTSTDELWGASVDQSLLSLWKGILNVGGSETCVAYGWENRADGVCIGDAVPYCDVAGTVHRRAPVPAMGGIGCIGALMENRPRPAISCEFVKANTGMRRSRYIYYVDRLVDDHALRVAEVT